jgi:hypothetical protein
MKKYLFLFLLALALSLVVGLGHTAVADAGEQGTLQEEIVGIWKFPVDGYYLGFDQEGWLCYGGSEASVAAKSWCNRYGIEDGVVTETCMGGPEDRNCPLGGGSCKARVWVDGEGQLQYRIIHDQCNMLAHKIVPPRQFTFTNE